MQNFHEHKLWQDAFVVLMDIHSEVDKLEIDGLDEEVAEALIVSAKNVAAKIADGLSRNDRRLGRDLIFDSVGLVAITRTELAIAWGRGLLDDSVFKSLDDKYSKLTDSLQRFK
jgi:hypothetical protein